MFGIFLWLVKGGMRSVNILADLGNWKIHEFRGKKPRSYSNVNTIDLLKARTAIGIFGFSYLSFIIDCTLSGIYFNADLFL